MRGSVVTAVWPLAMSLMFSALFLLLLVSTTCVGRPVDSFNRRSTDGIVGATTLPSVSVWTRLAYDTVKPTVRHAVMIMAPRRKRVWRQRCRVGQRRTRQGHCRDVL